MTSMMMMKKKSKEKEENHLKNNILYMYLETFMDEAIFSESGELFHTFELENIKDLLKHYRLYLGETTLIIFKLRALISWR